MTTEDKERDMIAKRRLRVTNGLVDIETIDNHIENVKNKSKKYISKGNDGVLIEINLTPEISNKQTVFKYNVLINDVENVLLIRDINTFLSSSFKLYKKMMDSFINEEDLEFNEIVSELDMPMVFDPIDKQLKLLFDNKKKNKVEEIVTDSESEEEEIEKIEEEDDGEGFYDDFDIGLYDSDDEDEEEEK